MTQIDTSKWGKFRVGDLFAIYLGDYNNPKFLTEDENGIPLVSATTINNGISGYYKKTPDLKVITKNKITWGKQCPYFCYQTTDFITGQGTYYLDVSTLSFYTNLFVCAVLNNEISQKYDYNNCLIGKKLSEEIILLPITTKGSPDWQFMEDYMKEITKLAAKRVEKLKEEKAEGKIDTSKWKKFKVGDLFETVNNNGKQVPTGANVLSKELKSGTVPRISVTGVNNGVVGYYDSTHKNYKVYNNFISVNFLGNAFYQENNASLDMKVHCLKLKNKELNKYLALFLITIINKLTASYSYANQLSSTSITQLQLPLPITPEGAPDFDYMENYMKNLTEKAKKKLSNIPQ